MQSYRVIGKYESSGERVSDIVLARDEQEAVRAAVEDRWFDSNYEPLCAIERTSQQIFRV